MDLIKPLTFYVQLSLDFLFGPISSFPEPGEEIVARSFDIQLGGGTLAYPIVLNRLKVPCRLLVKKGNTVQSDLAWDLLKKTGDYQIIAEETLSYDPVMSTAVFNLSNDRSFVSYNHDKALAFDSSFLFKYLKDSKVVFAQEQYLHLLPSLKEEGCLIVFDTGWHDDLSLKKYESILPFVDYFTPNDKEAMKMTGKGTVEESLVVLNDYVKHPIISCGRSGCKTMINKKIVHVKASRVTEVKDSIGAGDNFMAGLIYGIYRDMDLITSLKYANVAGALSVTAFGCYGRQYSLDELEEAAPMLEVVTL